MNLTKTLICGSLALVAFTACNSDNGDIKYEMTVPRTLLIASTNTSASSPTVVSAITSCKVGLDLYNNTTASFAAYNVRMANGNIVDLSAAPLKYTANTVGYTFVPQASTQFSGVSSASSFEFYMGGVNQINSRLKVVDGDDIVLGYSTTMYLFSETNVTSNGTLYSTYSGEKNVFQVLIQNLDNQYKANIYWLNPDFASNLDGTITSIAFSSLPTSIDPAAGQLTITGGVDAPITPKKVENGSSTLGDDDTTYKISNISFSVSDFANSVGHLSFDFEHTPKAAEGETPVTTTYRFSGTLRQTYTN